MTTQTKIHTLTHRHAHTHTVIFTQRSIRRDVMVLVRLTTFWSLTAVQFAGTNPWHCGLKCGHN